MALQDGYARKALLAEPDRLWERRDDPKMRMIDCGLRAAYERGHIPGAVHLGVHPWIKGGGLNADGRGRPLRSSLPVPTWATEQGDAWLYVTPPEEFAALMGSLGISADSTVVTYDDAGGAYAARLSWALTYYGHPNVQVLNGGWHRWLAERRPVTSAPPAHQPGQFVARPRSALICTLEELRGQLAEPGVRVLDVRSDAEWLGLDDFGNQRAGHIPGATHLEWLRFVTADDRKVLKPAAELHAMISQAGISPEHEVITHCQAGIRAAYGAFVLALLGWQRVRVYDGSMLEWANRDDTPLLVEE